MTTLIINENSLEARKFIEYAKTLSFVEESTHEITKDRMATHPVWEVMPRRMTKEEFNEIIDRSIEDERMGRVISHEEMGKKIAQWR